MRRAHPAESGAVELRRHGRLRCHLLACELGPVLNLSASGAAVCYTGRRPPQAGDVMELTLRVLDLSQGVRARVVHCRPSGGRDAQIGLNFIDMTPEQAVRLMAVARVAMDPAGCSTRAGFEEGVRFLRPFGRPALVSEVLVEAGDVAGGVLAVLRKAPRHAGAAAVAEPEVVNEHQPIDQRVGAALPALPPSRPMIPAAVAGASDTPVAAAATGAVVEVAPVAAAAAPSSPRPPAPVERVESGAARELRGLLAQWPEVASGAVRVRAVARRVGVRAKVALERADGGDPPALFAPGGAEVAALRARLRPEKLDLLRWHDDPRRLIAEALSPASPGRIEPDPATRAAEVYVNDIDAALLALPSAALLPLAEELTGWKVRVRAG